MRLLCLISLVGFFVAILACALPLLVVENEAVAAVLVVALYGCLWAAMTEPGDG